MVISLEIIPLLLSSNLLLTISKLGPRSMKRLLSQTVETFNSRADTGRAGQTSIKMAARRAVEDLIFTTPSAWLVTNNIRFL
jgi:ABC-type sulfate transport system permease component